MLEETYSGQRVVIAFGQEERVLDRFDQANEAVRKAGVRAMTLALLVMPMMGILSNLNVAILCGLGGWLAIRGVVTIGTIAAFITLLAALCRAAAPAKRLVQPGPGGTGRGPNGSSISWILLPTGPIPPTRRICPEWPGR